MNNLQRVFRRGHFRNKPRSAMFPKSTIRLCASLHIVRHVRASQKAECHFTQKFASLLNIYEHKQDGKYCEV